MKKILLVLLMCLIPVVSEAASGTLTWNGNTETDLAGYKVYREPVSCGAFGAVTATHKPTLLATLGKVTTYIDNAIPATVIAVCYWITAYDGSGNTSGFSVPAGKNINVAVVPKVTALVLTDQGYTVTVTSGAVEVQINTSTETYKVPVPSGQTIVNIIHPRPVNTTFVCAKAVDINGIVNSVSTDYRCVAAAPSPAIPPAIPSGLQISKNTVDEVIIVAKIVDCRDITMSTIGSTSVSSIRSIQCVR